MATGCGCTRCSCTTPGGWLEDLGQGFDRLGADVGKSLCAATPKELRIGLARFSRSYAPVLNNPYFAFLMNAGTVASQAVPVPLLVQAALDLAETCDLAVTTRRAACRAAMACEIVLALAPLAGGIALISGVGIVTVAPAIGALTLVAGAAGPLFTAVCERRAPTLEDFIRVGALVTEGAMALSSGNFDAAVAAVTHVGQKAMAMPGSPSEQVRASFAQAERNNAPLRAALAGKPTTATGPSARERAKARMRAKAAAAAAEAARKRAEAAEAKIDASEDNAPVKRPSSSSSMLWAAAGALLIAGASR